jgi:hypothetical protein
MIIAATLLGLAGVLEIRETPTATQLAFGARVVRTTTAEVVAPRQIEVSGSDARIARWDEVDADGVREPWYAIWLDEEHVTVRRTDYRLRLRHAGGFDPLERTPAFYEDSPLAASDGVYLVQYETQPLAAYQERVRALGGRVTAYVAQHANLVRMSAETRAAVSAEPFVRAVLPFHAELRLEPFLLDLLGTGALAGPNPYNVWVLDREAGDAVALAARVTALGGEVRDLSERSSLVGVMLNGEQLAAVAARDEVLFIDRHTSLEPDLDIVRAFSGTNALELATGFSGQNVRGEVADTNVETTHPGFLHNGGVELHGGMTGTNSHGTSVYGIVFGDGTGSPSLRGRGILPDSAGLFADADSFGWLNSQNPTNRANHTAELVDPNGPYRGLFQTNSTGSSRTLFYTTISANMDQIAFDNDVVILHTMGNSGLPSARPEAWAKNVVGVGGIYHNNTLTTDDDGWNFGATNGPAEDGRLKPELSHFYDQVYTASVGANYTPSFGGTSASTPITAGHFGLFFQLWHDGAFGNAPRGVDPFDSKPHAETAVAAMVNTAVPWEFTGTTHSLTRVNQGFGRVDVDQLYQTRNETVWRDRLQIDNLETQTHPVTVAVGATLLKVTMVYRDLPGNPGSLPHRVNDLSLRVTDPSGTVYHGNVGLTESNTSLPGGQLNDIDTVENVWVPSPTPGTWTVEVLGVDVNADLYPGVAGNNADYSLWITGASDGSCSSAPTSYCTAGTSSAGCQASISASGTASASAATGFDLVATGAEGGKNGLFFFGANGRQAQPWGNGTSFQCVVPPVKRGALLPASGLPSACDGSFVYDLNARWTAKPAQNPGSGAVVQAQLWHRDPLNTSNKKTTLSDALEFSVCP